MYGQDNSCYAVVLISDGFGKQVKGIVAKPTARQLYLPLRKAWKNLILIFWFYDIYVYHF